MFDSKWSFGIYRRPDRSSVTQKPGCQNSMTNIYSELYIVNSVRQYFHDQCVFEGSGSNKPIKGNLP